MRQGRNRLTDEQGLTMMELLVAMIIVGLVSVLSTTGWLRYQRSVEHRGSAQELSSLLRNAQQAALAEAVTYCVQVDAANRRYRLFKFSCGATGVAAQPAKYTQSGRVGLTAASFVQPDGSTSSNVSFYPRGAATRGSAKVTRSGSNKIYTISVEGLTGRVSLTG